MNVHIIAKFKNGCDAFDCLRAVGPNEGKRYYVDYFCGELYLLCVDEKEELK